MTDFYKEYSSEDLYVPILPLFFGQSAKIRSEPIISLYDFTENGDLVYIYQLLSSLSPAKPKDSVILLHIDHYFDHNIPQMNKVENKFSGKTILS